MRRRRLLQSAATSAAAAPIALLATARPAGALFVGGNINIGPIVAVLKIIQDILDSRFAEMLEGSAMLANIANVTEQLNGLLELYSKARGLFYTLDAIAETFDGLYTAAKDLNFTGLRFSEQQLMLRFKTLSRQAADIQATIVSSSAWEAATTQLLTMASRGTTTVSGQLQIMNQLNGQLASQSLKIQALLATQTEIMAEQLAERELVREQSAIIQSRFWEGFRTAPDDAPQLRLPGILD